VIAAVTVLSTIVVSVRYGMYAAILWFSFPVGTLGYLKARFAPLVVRPEDYAK
jgi:hypothetical protein